MITIGYSFVGKNYFFVEKYDKEWRNLELYLLIFFAFFSFFLFLAKFLYLL